jgi:hypothetical protein
MIPKFLKHEAVYEFFQVLQFYRSLIFFKRKGRKIWEDFGNFLRIIGPKVFIYYIRGPPAPGGCAMG